MTAASPRGPRGWLLLLAWLVACAAMADYAAQWPTDNRVGRWASQVAGGEGYTVLVERFGGDESVLLRTDGFTADDADARDWIERLGPALAAQPAVEAVADPLSLPGHRTGTPLAELASDPLVRGLDLVGLDPPRVDVAALVAPAATPGERAELAAAIDELTVAAREHGLRLRAAGHPLLAAALDAEARRIERVFGPLLALAALFGVALFLRSFPYALLTLLPAVFGSSAARAALRLAGVDSDLILVAIGPLVLVLLLAGTLHFVCAFLRRRAEGLSRRKAVRAARADKLAAGSLAALTTAVGFGVFALSDLRSVALLGTTVACAVLVGVPLVFGALAPMLGVLQVPPQRPTRAHPERFRRLAAWAVRRRRPLVLLLVLVLAGGALAPLGLETQTSALHYFPRAHPLKAAFTSLEAEGAALSSVEVLVHRDGERGWDPTELRALGLTARLAAVPGVRGVFGPEAVADAVSASAPTLASAALVPGALRAARRLDADGTWARWSVRMATAEADETQALVRAIRGATGTPAGAGAVLVTGSVPLLLEVQSRLLGTLAISLAGTALATALLFLFVARTPRELLAAVSVNLFPVACALIFAWALAIPLDSATVMVAAVVLGLAVDNTFHLMHAGHAGGRTGRAALRGFGRVGEAAAVSSVALTLGFGALALSGFAPTARFGLSCAAGTACALLANLVLLPALWIRPAHGRGGRQSVP